MWYDKESNEFGKILIGDNTNIGVPGIKIGMNCISHI